jgi:hypothetical protein
MNISYVYRRALMLSIAVILAVSILAAVLVSMSFSHTAARTSPHVHHSAASQNATIKGSIKRYIGDGAVPSWDVMTLYVTVRCFS